MNIFKGPLGLGEECFDFGHEISYRREHHHHVQDIYQAARQGCFICDRLWQKVFWRYGPSATLHLEECLLLSSKKPGGTLLLLITYGFDEPNQFCESFSLVPTLGIGIPKPFVGKLMVGQGLDLIFKAALMQTELIVQPPWILPYCGSIIATLAIQNAKVT